MTQSLETRLAELKATFDGSFTVPLAEPAGNRVALLRIRVAAERFVLRVDGLAGIQAGLPILPLPQPHPAFRGLVAIRGQIVPAYDLAGLLGVTPADQPPRWVTLAAGAALAFGFDHLEGFLEIPAAALPAAVGRPGDFAPGRLEGTGRLVDLPAIVGHLLDAGA